MNKAVAILGLLMLAACSKAPTTEQDMSACWLDALRTYSHIEKVAQQPLVSDFIYICMKSKAYQFKGGAGCKTSGDVLDVYIADTSPECYEPKP